MKASHKRLESDGDGEQGDAKKPGFGNEQPVTPPADDAMLSLGERAPKTPRLVAQVTSTDLSLYEHEDSAVKFEFSSGDLDELEQ